MNEDSARERVRCGSTFIMVLPRASAVFGSDPHTLVVVSSVYMKLRIRNAEILLGKRWSVTISGYSFTTGFTRTEPTMAVPHTVDYSVFTLQYEYSRCW